MKSVSLPDLPKGKEFEEYISAFFQCGGFYTERNIEERDIEQILELDVVATNYDEKWPKSLIIEVKSGNWGFADLFKVKGWLDYLVYKEGLLITNKPKENPGFYKDKATEIGVNLFQIDNLDKIPEILNEIVPNYRLDEIDFKTWRFSYWIERNLLRDLKDKKKKFYRDKLRYQRLDEYYFLLNSSIFFTKNIVGRVHKLYEIYQKYPHISAKCGNECIGNNFDDVCDTLPQELYVDTFYKCIYNDIQVSTFIEHRARLALLKNAIDYILNKGNPRDKQGVAFGIDYEKALLHLLPSSFQNGMKELKKHKYMHKYPVFWQWFMWIFGGFILKDYEEKEYEILSEKSGIPIGEIPRAFESYQLLFPREDGWFLDLSTRSDSNIVIMQMFPVPFMGVGVNYRRLIYTESQKFADLKLSGTHTINDLIKWNNLTINVLTLNQ